MEHPFLLVMPSPRPSIPRPKAPSAGRRPGGVRAVGPCRVPGGPYCRPERPTCPALARPPPRDARYLSPCRTPSPPWATVHAQVLPSCVPRSVKALREPHPYPDTPSTSKRLQTYSYRALRHRKEHRSNNQLFHAFVPCVRLCVFHRPRFTHISPRHLLRKQMA
jgi:hypothetical protein